MTQTLQPRSDNEVPRPAWIGIASSLLARGAPGDDERARALANESLARATSLGLEPDVRRARAVLEQLT